MNATTRRSISSSALTCAHKSPITWSGSRTLARNNFSKVRSSCPAWQKCMAGIWKPSSNTSRDSLEPVRPPMSGACAVLAAKPITRAPRKIGLQTVTSARWPVPIQGSFVMNTSPGRMPSIVNSAMKCLTVSGSVPMNEGMLCGGWTSPRPASSATMQEKSCASRTTAENEVRINAADASLTIEIRRVQ